MNRLSLSTALAMLVVLGGMLVSTETSAQIGRTYYESPRKPMRAPMGGDVVFSARSAQAEAPRVAKEFYANRIEWIYSNSATYVDALKVKGFTVGLTLNANPKMDDDGYARSFDDIPVIAPWMKAWGVKWATSASLKGTTTILTEARKLIASGADAIQFDDADLQYSITKWSDGDFSPASLSGFQAYINRQEISPIAIQAGLVPSSTENYKNYLIRSYGVKSSADYIHRKKTFPTTAIWERYLMSSVRDFHISLKKLLATEKSRYTPLSFNIELLPQEQALYIADLADYVIVESSDYDAASISMHLATARAVATGYVASLIPRDVAATRAAIAQHYALGVPVVVPWDMYMPDVKGMPQPRYVGRPEDFADIFQFVRENRVLLDYAEIPAIVVVAIPLASVDMPELRRVIGVLTQRAIPFAFALSGGIFKTYSIEPSKLKGMAAVIRMGKSTEFTTNDSKAIDGYGGSVVVAKDINEKWADVHSSVKISGGSGVTSNMMVANKNTGVVALHLVANSVEDKSISGTPLTVEVSRNVIPKNTMSAVLYSVGNRPKEIMLSETSDGISFSIPKPAVWSIVSFTPMNAVQVK